MTFRFHAPGRQLKGLVRTYELLWFPAVAAWALFAGAKRRRRLMGRLAPGLPAAGPNPGAIWIHALSVGEVLSALPLVDGMRSAYPDTDLVFTVTTVQGMQVASRSLAGKIEWLLPMPLDFPRAISRMVDFLRPSLFVLVETDIWPGLLGHLKSKSIPSVLVNGRISPGTFTTYRRFSPFVRKLFDRFSLCLMQTPLDRDRLLAVGIPPERVLAVGNIKFDRKSDPMQDRERGEWGHRLGLADGDRLLVAGSTHPGENTVLITAFKRLLAVNPRLRLIVAPRRVETAGDLLRQALELGLKARLRSEETRSLPAWEVLVIDSLGELERLYGLGDICFVGGSLVPMGGHNLLEPAAFGKPVLFGPHTYNFDQMACHLEASGGGVRVSDGNALYAGVEKLLGDDARRRAAGAAAKAFVEENQGNVNRVISHIESIRRGGNR